MDIEYIKSILPHRYPFLMIDQVVEVDEGKYCKAVKGVTGNEAHFQGHFPGNPVMPGVLIIEAMAQACGIAAYTPEVDVHGQWLFLAGVERVRFKKPVIPGDQLILESEFKSNKMNIWVFSCKASVDGKRVAQAEIRLATIPKNL